MIKKFVVGAKIVKYNHKDIKGTPVTIVSRTDTTVTYEVPHKNGMYNETSSIEINDVGDEYIVWEKYGCVEYRATADTEATVLVDYEHLNTDGYGDFVRCSDCGTLFLMKMGDEKCRVCRRFHLVWVDENRPECSVEELKQLGYYPIEINRKSVRYRLEEFIDQMEELDRRKKWKNNNLKQEER